MFFLVSLNFVRKSLRMTSPTPDAKLKAPTPSGDLGKWRMPNRFKIQTPTKYLSRNVKVDSNFRFPALLPPWTTGLPETAATASGSIVIDELVSLSPFNPLQDHSFQFSFLLLNPWIFLDAFPLDLDFCYN